MPLIFELKKDQRRRRHDKHENPGWQNVQHFTPEERRRISSKGGKRGMHVRWHVNRGIRKEGCVHCEATK